MYLNSIYHTGDPFYGVFEAQEDIKTVTVRAINCVGQRATQMVTTATFPITITMYVCLPAVPEMTIKM